jgi:hypothetical protein
MRIVAQSEVPSKMPFVHLGYLSASASHVTAGLTFVMGVMLAITGFALIAARFGRWSRRVGFVLLAAGILACIVDLKPPRNGRWSEGANARPEPVVATEARTPAEGRAP